MQNTPTSASEARKSSSSSVHPLTVRTREFLFWVRQTAQFSATKRLVWKPYTNERECVGAHSYQLCMVAWYVCSRYLPHLDLLTVFKLCLVHDAPEYKGGDTPAFLGRFGEFTTLPTHETKEEREATAIVCLVRLWKRRFNDFITSLLSYEPRDTEEKQLVYALDKLLANVNVYLDNGYTDKRLGITIEQVEDYKRHKIAEHPLVLLLHDEIMAYVRTLRPDLQYFEGQAKAPPRET